MRTLYVTDLDGTLLRSDGALSRKSREWLQLLLLDGLVFSVASARSFVSIRPIVDGLSLTLPVIEFSGAFLTDIKTGRHEVVNSMVPAVGRELLALIERLGHSPFVSTFDGTNDWLYFRQSTNDGERFYVSNRQNNDDQRLRLTEDLTCSVREQIVCFTVIGAAEPLNELKESVLEQFGDHVEVHFFENQYSPGWFWLTIHDHRATKDQAIGILRESYGLAEHELVVFGDHTNDVKMFQIASHAVAVANAHPEVMRHATQTIGSNDDDSVMEFIRNHVLGHDSQSSHDQR